MCICHRAGDHPGNSMQYVPYKCRVGHVRRQVKLDAGVTTSLKTPDATSVRGNTRCMHCICKTVLYFCSEYVCLFNQSPDYSHVVGSDLLHSTIRLIYRLYSCIINTGCKLMYCSIIRPAMITLNTAGQQSCICRFTNWDKPKRIPRQSWSGKFVILNTPAKVYYPQNTPTLAWSGSSSAHHLPECGVSRTKEP